MIIYARLRGRVFRVITTNPVASLAWVRSPGDALLVVWSGGKESSTGFFQEIWLGNYTFA